MVMVAAPMLAACQSAPFAALGRGEKEQEAAPAASGQLADRSSEAISGDRLLSGHRLMAAGDYEMALKFYLRAAADQGMNAEVLASIGSANLHLGRLGQAEQVLRRAVEIEPENIAALNNLGVVMIERGRPGDARALFEQAFALDSGKSDEILKNLKLAIARSEEELYSSDKDPAHYSLIRRGPGEYDILSKN